MKASSGDAADAADGARQHNLKNMDVDDLPRDALVVFTGVSGSGKSSLAFGTLYAEAQLRYLESVAPYARRLFHQMGIPDVDEIDGIPPSATLRARRRRGSVDRHAEPVRVRRAFFSTSTSRHRPAEFFVGAASLASVGMLWMQ